MKRIFAFFAAAGTIAFALPATAADKSWMVENFEGIAVSGRYDVDVTTGTGQRVVATGPQKALDRLLVDVDGDTLRIRERRGDWRGWFSGSEPVKISVTVPRLTSARLSGSGDLDVDNMAGANIELALAGSGDLTVDDMTATSVETSLAGSGDIIASGTCRTGDFSVAGSGDISAKSLTCRRVEASVAGSGNIEVEATETAELSIAGSGDITVTGGAKCTGSSRGSGDWTCS
ncbi:MAG: head GIN domain-containing protein [Pacificimonas sp.]